MLSTLLTLFIVGLVVLVVLSIVLSLIGAALSLVGFLLFKVAPVLLVGYFLIRFLRPRKSRLEELELVDRKAIEGE